MKWFDVDGARDYLAECGSTRTPNGRERRPSRKVLYNMVKAGLKVSRPHGDRHLVFCAEWIDEYLQQRTTKKNQPAEPPITLIPRGAA